MEYAFLALGGVGLIVALVGGIWLLVEAFKESTLWGVGCLLCGPVQLAFIIQHWQAAKRPFALNLAGAALCFGAGAGLGWAESAGGADPWSPADVAVPDFPVGLGPGEPLPGQVTKHVVRLASDQSGYYTPPGRGGQVWVYLPPGYEAAPPGSLPCVLVPPAGTSGLTGIKLGEGDMPEHTPYAEAGFVVVAYELDGPLTSPDDAPSAEVQRAYLAYSAAQAGVVNGRNALELVLQRLPAVSPRAIFVAGHSSAGGAALLLAAHEPRLAGCLAYAPVADLVERHGEWAIGDEWLFPGLKQFLRRASPLTHVGRVGCPVYLFHSLEDEVVDAASTRVYAGQLRAHGGEVTYQEAAEGDHYQSMIDQGVPAGIAWLEARVATLGVRPAASAGPTPIVERPTTPSGAAAPATPPRGSIDWDDPQVVLTRAGSDDEEVRREALGQWQRRGQDRRPGARQSMLEALGAAAAQPALMRVLLRSVSEHPLPAREALSCLPLAPGELRQAILRRLVDFPEDDVPAAEVARGVEGTPETPDALVEELQVRGGLIREGAAARLIAARGLEWARSPEARPLLDRLPPAQLIDLARQPEEPLRLLAVRLLAARGAEVALAPLGALLRDPARAVRQEAAGALGDLGDAQAVVPILSAMSEEQDEPTRVRLRRALANLPSQAVFEVLETLLEDPAPTQRLVAVSGLLAYASPGSVRQLGKALADPDLSVRLAALKALGELRTSRVQGVPESLRQVTNAIGKLAGSADVEEKRLARHLYYQLMGRLPESR